MFTMHLSDRVTPGGRIEDEGDFSDFYKLPDELDEVSRMEIQASQDEVRVYLSLSFNLHRSLISSFLSLSMS